MANPNMKVSVLVELVDRLTAPLRGLTRGIGNIARSVGDLGRRIGVLGATFAALSFISPIKQAAAWDTQIRDIAITAGRTGLAAETMIGDLTRQYQKLAFLTGQTSDDVAKGAKTLIAGNVAPELMEKLLPTIAKVATATGATMIDTAKTVLSLSDTLKIPSAQMEEMLGKLAVAGKLGRFEFADMARALPELSAQMAKLGVTGREAVEHLGASLQIAMIGTADPGQAATNLNNFLTKINAPEAIKKFEKELKVDITGVMTDATAKGINPIEAVIGKLVSKLKAPQVEIDKIMKKAGATDKQREEQIKTLLAGTNVGKLYADMQVLGFILPMMQNLDKFKEFRDQLKTAGVGTIVDDFATRMKGLQPQLNQFGVLAASVGNRIGLAFASNLPTAMKAIEDLLKWVDSLDQKWPGLIDTTLSWAGAGLLLGASLAVLTPVVRGLALAVALLFSPIAITVLALAALAYGAYYVWQNWDEIAPKLKAIWDGMVQPFKDAWAGIKQAFADAWAAIEQTGADIVAWGQALPGRIVDAIADLGGRLKNAGLDAIGQLWDGMKAKFGELVEWAKGIPRMIADAIGSIKLPFTGGPMPGTPGGSGVDPMGNPTGMITPGSAPGAGIGGSNGFTRTAGGPASNSNTTVGGRIVVEASEGSRIVNVQSENPAVPITPNRGGMLLRA